MTHLNSYLQELQSIIYFYEKMTDKRRSIKCYWSLSSQYADQWIFKFIFSQQSWLQKSENWYKNLILTYYLHKYRWSRISDEQNQYKECLKYIKV